MKIDQRAFSAVLLGAVLQGAVFPSSAAQPVPAVPGQAPVAATYEYRADVSGTARRQGAVKAGGINWNCSGAYCTTAGPWPVPSVEACHALAEQVGFIKRYGHATRQLTPAQLKSCNAKPAATTAKAKTPPAAMIGKGGIAAGARPGVQPALDPGVAANLKPQHIEPMTPGVNVGRAGASATGVPLPGAAAQAMPGVQPGMAATPGLTPGAAPGASPSGTGGGGRHATPQMIEEIRTAAGGIATRPNITAVRGSTPDGYCSTNGYFRVVGTNFGQSQGGRRVVLARRDVPVLEATVRSWSDTLVEATFGSNPAIDPGVAYNVGLQDERGRWISNIDRQVRRCPDRLEIVGTIRIENCAAGPSNVVVEIVDGLNVWRVNATAVPGNDFLFQYRSPALRPGGYSLRPSLTGIVCNGGAWTPENPRVTVSYRLPQVTQDLQFAVPAREFRLPLTTVAGLVRDAFRGLVVHLNNFDPATGGERANDSYVRLPERLGGGEWQLALLPVRTGPRTYYVNDVNLQSATVRATATGLRVQLDFESDNNAGRLELVGVCRDDAGCIVGAPDVDLRLRVFIDLALALHLVPGTGHTLSFSDVSVTAEPATVVSGACQLNWCALIGAPLPIHECMFDVCDLATNYRSTIRSAVEGSIRSALDTQDVRNRIGRAIREELTRLGIGSLTGVRIEGSNLVLTYLDNAR
ncbi:MAG TPA: hypothetical protein VF203_02950 [Burkholderiales bacterium]